MIQNIQIKSLCPHPANPRKDLGDLTELTESIKARGIMQNLTVVPYIGEVTGEPIEGLYRIIIGHRRYEAAKIAGLTELPCVVAEMTEQEQIATMLLENIQRVDLTVYEQAQGFQMMLDLGDKISNISEKTGFSETTVRRRVKLMELDQDKLEEASGRNVTIMDLEKLEKIKDIELRNEVLEKIGTNNFDWALRNAIEKEKSIVAMEKIIEQLSLFATEIENTDGLIYVRAYHDTITNELVEVPEDAGKVNYFYKRYSYGSLYLYKEKSDDDIRDMAKKEEKKEKDRARYLALDEFSERTYVLRRDFAKSISNEKAKKKIDTIVEFGLHSMLESYNSLDPDDLAGLLEIELSEDDDAVMGELLQDLPSQPYRYLLLATYGQLDSSNENYHRWDSTYCENENLDRIYGFLKMFGYEMSDEEKAMQDGTHYLFKKESE